MLPLSDRGSATCCWANRLRQTEGSVRGGLLVCFVGKAGASDKTQDKVRSDEDAGLRQGMLSMSSKVAAAGKEGDGEAATAQADLAATSRDAAVSQRTGPKGTAGSTARGSMVRTADPTKAQVNCCSGV